MAFDTKTLATAAFKRINVRAHTANSKELANEAVASGITLTFENIIGQTISPTGSQAVADGVALHLSGANVLSATLDITSNGKAYILTVPSGNLLIGRSKPGGGTYKIGDRAQRIIPQSFGLDYRPVLFNNVTEVPPLDARDWYLDEFAGIITSEEDLNLVNGTVQCYAYIGQYLSDTVTSGSGAPLSASYVTMFSESGLPNERVLTAGTGISIVDGGPGGSVTISATGSGSGGPVSGSFVTLNSEPTVAGERVLTAGAGITITDGGPDNTVIIETTSADDDDCIISPLIRDICNEIPNGIVDGVNRDFRTAYVPDPPACLKVYVNGARQRSGTLCDYELDYDVIQFKYNIDAPANIIVDYKYMLTAPYYGIVCSVVPHGAVDGENNIFSLCRVPNPPESLLVFKNGLAQMSGSDADYILSGQRTIKFIDASPDAGNNIFARYFYGSEAPVFEFHQVPSGAIDGINSVFELSSVPLNSASLMVFSNGFALMPGSSYDYVLSGTTLTLNYTPTSGTNLFVQYMTQTGSLAASSFIMHEIPSGVVDGVNDAFVLASTSSNIKCVQAYRNGLALMQGPNLDYTVSGSSVIFNSGAIPSSGSTIFVNYLT